MIFCVEYSVKSIPFELMVHTVDCDYFIQLCMYLCIISFSNTHTHTHTHTHIEQMDCTHVDKATLSSYSSAGGSRLR